MLDGNDLSLREILVVIAALTGRRAPKIRQPPAAVMPAAIATKVFARLTGRALVATVEEIRRSK